MEQYLLELIKSNNRVIVPNFGAFIVSRDAGTTVLFNNFLSFNDGLLINHISSKKGIETTEATDLVSDFVDKVKKELDDKGEYSIDKLGTFTKDQNGILRFTQDSHLAKLLPDETDENPETEKSEDGQLLDIDSSATNEPTPDEKQKAKELEKKKPVAGAKKDNKLLNLDEKKEEPVKTQPIQANKKSAGKKTPVAGASGGGSAGKYEENRNGLPPWLIALLILIPIVLIILYLFFWRDSGKEEPVKVAKKEVVDSVAAKAKTDSIALVKAQEEERLKQEKEVREKAEAEKAKGPRHHIIVGSFKDEANAQKLIKKLKDNGFEEAQSLSHNNMVLVSAESYESVLKARDAQERVLQEQRMENWILTKK